MARVVSVPTAAIECTRNPRKTLDGLDELAASIQQHGILQPLGVRSVTGESGEERIELVFGQRRLAAARQLGMQEVPCVVLEMTDEEADEAAIIENLQRADIPPLEEADAFRLMLDRNPLLTVEELALRVGKAPSAVRMRLALALLCPSARDALTAGTLTLGAAQELARVDNQETQAELTRELLQDWRVVERGDAVTRAWAREAVLKHARPLRLAPFDVADAGLDPEAGACTRCPKRTNAQGALFGLAADKEDRCMDGACWSGKVTAHNARIAAEAKARGAKVLSAEQAKNVTPGHGMLKAGWLKLSDRIPLPHPADDPANQEPAEDPSKTDEENDAALAAYWEKWNTLLQQWREAQTRQPTYAEKLAQLGVDHLVERVVVELDGVATEVARRSDVVNALKAVGAAPAQDHQADEQPEQRAPRETTADKQAREQAAKREAAVEDRTERLMLDAAADELVELGITDGLRVLALWRLVEMSPHPRAVDLATHHKLLEGGGKVEVSTATKAIRELLEKTSNPKELLNWMVWLEATYAGELTEFLVDKLGLKRAEFEKQARKQVLAEEKANAKKKPAVRKVRS